ncbi:hypothetical protein AABC73_02880 [Pseudomonas sp. G.S.17]|uniref:hypothetical protein n=1 Tax=Pseudomonas sp. G.S.17 TaxID=3137451 RepID=UPI00311CC442
MKNVLIFVAGIFAVTKLHASVVEGVSGTLIYSEGAGGSYNSLVYKSRNGMLLHVFDEGLKFDYDGRYDEGNLSPDKNYSIVYFTESGFLSGDNDAKGKEYKYYLCAFVRMADGCVLSVETGQQCDGEWDEAGRWNSSIESNDGHLPRHPITVDKIYEDYISGSKDTVQVSAPKILAYFPEGTSFDNLLACDPPRKENVAIYGELMVLLGKDGDFVNFEKLKAIMRVSGNLY